MCVHTCTCLLLYNTEPQLKLSKYIHSTCSCQYNVKYINGQRKKEMYGTRPSVHLILTAP